MERGPYLRFDPLLEQVAPDEAAIFDTILASIAKTSEASTRKFGRGIRQQHAKGHGYLRGELLVYDDLPPLLRQGAFASGRRYPVIARFSTAFGDLRSDRIRRARGLAIKILGVPGPKAFERDRSANQDFLLVNHKNYIADARAYLSLQKLMEIQPKTPDILFRAGGVFARFALRLKQGFGAEFPMALLALSDAGNDIIGETFYSEGALRFGEYVARLAAAPVSAEALARRGLPMYAGDEVVGRSVTEFFAHHGAEYELRAQLAVDLERTPIEDASVDWNEEITPFQPLGKLMFPAQNTDSAARRDYCDTVLSFDPWRALADHQPLGSIMRLRKDAYRLSAERRHSANGSMPLTEPRDISELPD